MMGVELHDGGILTARLLLILIVLPPLLALMLYSCFVCQRHEKGSWCKLRELLKGSF
jgi:hypothetical protein